MLRKTQLGLLAAGLVLFAAQSPLGGQTQDAPTPPPPTPAPPPGPVLGAPVPVPPPAPVVPPAVVPYQDRNGPLLRGDPLLDPPTLPPPGWFAALEVDIVGPHIKNLVGGTATLNGFAPNVIALPIASLDWTGAPRFELGYRLSEGFGEFLLSYRFLTTEGQDTIPRFDPFSPGFLRSRLDVNVIDLDYASREFGLEFSEFLPWDMKWRAGVSYGDVFFDSQAHGAVLLQRM